MNKRFFYGWIIVGVATVTLFMGAGVLTSFGVFFKPMQEEFGWNRASVSLAMSIGMILYGLSQAISGRLVDKYGPRVIIATGATLMGLGTLTLSATTNLWQLYLFFGIIASYGYGGMAMVTNSAMISRWFNKKRGIALGVVTSGFSAGQLFLTPLSMFMTLNYGWRSAYLVLGALLLVVVLPPVLWLVKKDPADLGLLPDGESPVEKIPNPVPFTKKDHPAPVVERTSMSQAMATRSFWLLVLGFFGCGFTALMVATHLVAFATDQGISEMTAANALGLVGGMSIVGALVFGPLSDRWGRKNLLALAYLLRALSLLLLIVVNSSTTLYVAAIVSGISLATVPLTSALSGDLFGRFSVGTIFGIVSLSHQIGAAIGTYLAGAVFDLTSSYYIAFLLATAIALFSAAVSYTVKEKRPLALAPKGSKAPTLQEG